MDAAGFRREEYLAACALLDLPVPAAFPLRPDGHLPLWLTPPLVATTAAKARVRRWHDLGEPYVDISHIPVMAEPALLTIVREVLGVLPPPVLLHLLHHGQVVALGASCAGLCGTAWRPHVDAVEGRRLAVAAYHAMPDADLADGIFAVTVAHELCHAWLEPGPPLLAPISTDEIVQAIADRSVMYRLGEQAACLLDAARERGIRELRVGALLQSWGFAERADACARHAEKLYLDVARAHLA